MLTIRSNRPVVFTTAAADKAAALSDDASLPLRVQARPGGCAGFTYDMFFDSDPVSADDVTLTFGALTVVVDPRSAEIMSGTTVDYVEGLAESGFKFDNPSTTRSCGCGKSFA